ncbi:MAG: hypothetical protein ING59_07775 [Burkholderiales bacterium]|nr:hypothetical protein [Burkholderiales bacterium]
MLFGQLKLLREPIRGGERKEGRREQRRQDVAGCFDCVSQERDAFRSLPVSELRPTTTQGCRQQTPVKTTFFGCRNCCDSALTRVIRASESNEDLSGERVHQLKVAQLTRSHV